MLTLTYKRLLRMALPLLFCLPPGAVRAADFPQGSPPFHTLYADFVAERKRTGKPGVIVFSATWCASCQTMKRKVYHTAPVRPYHDKFVWAWLDVDDPANQAAAKLYQTGGLPHLEFLNPNGKPVARLLGKKDAATLARQLAAVAPKPSPAAR